MIVIRNGWFWMALALVTFGFLFLIKSILLPFVVGIMVAYFLDPLVDRLEARNLPRWLATLIVILAFFLIGGLGLTLVAPLIYEQLVQFIGTIPDVLRVVKEKYLSQVRPTLYRLDPALMNTVSNNMGEMSEKAIGFVTPVVQGVLRSGIALVNVVSLLFIAPVVSYYLLRDWDRMVAAVDNLLPRRHAPVIRQQFAIMDRTIAGFVRGQTYVCFLLGTFYAIGLTLVGLKFGLLIGLLTGMLTFIPYVGLLMGMTAGVLVAVFQFGDWHPVALVLAVFIVGQFIEGNFVTPRIVGDKVGLHPVWVIFGLLVGGVLFGFVGVLLAVPVTAIIGVLVRFAIGEYQKSALYRGPLPKRKAPITLSPAGE